MNTTPVKIVETVLRDGHQSLAATRMRITDMVPVLEELDDMGYYALEAWGGATFDACLRFLDEDPWDRLRLIRKKCPNTKLQMLFRGQNILGYKHYADDVVDAFCRKSIENGIDIIRIFDALNDVDQMRPAIDAVRTTSSVAEVALCYTSNLLDPAEKRVAPSVSSRSRNSTRSRVDKVIPARGRKTRSAVINCTKSRSPTC